jgi:tRNA-dihydrouridine synthase
VDLNLGCPQREAFSGHFGAYLLGPEDRALVLNCISTMARGLKIPVMAKIRLLDDQQDTLELIRQLERAGAAAICVHARYRGSPTHRRDGPAHLHFVREIQAVASVPIITNGNVRNFVEAQQALIDTKADAVMSAEGLLDSPALFAPVVNVVPGSPLDLALEYIDFTKRFPTTPPEWIARHVARVCKKELRATDLEAEVLRARDEDEWCRLITQCKVLMINGQKAVKPDTGLKLSKKQLREVSFSLPLSHSLTLSCPHSLCGCLLACLSRYISRFHAHTQEKHRLDKIARRAKEREEKARSQGGTPVPGSDTAMKGPTIVPAAARDSNLTLGQQLQHRQATHALDSNLKSSRGHTAPGVTNNGGRNANYNFNLAAPGTAQPKKKRKFYRQ